MRTLVLAIIAASPLGGGCSYRIVRSGIDPCQFKTKDEVHEALGEPVSESFGTRVSAEDFRTRVKIAERERAEGISLAVGNTNGLLELYMGPFEMGTLIGRTVTGQTLRFLYDENDKVTDVLLNGSSLHTNRAIAAANGKPQASAGEKAAKPKAANTNSSSPNEPDLSKGKAPPNS
jgi:hypothetical protein